MKKILLLLLPFLCLAQRPAERSDREPWNGNFTGQGQQTLVLRSTTFYLSNSPGPDAPSEAQAGSLPPGIDPATVYAGEFALDGRTSLAAFDASQQQWLSGRIGDTGQLTWQPAGNRQMFQLVDEGPALFPPPPASKRSISTATAHSEQAMAASVAVSGSWPVHATQRDHIQCGDVTTDLYLYSDGTIRGSMSLKGTCWLAGTHGSMIAIFMNPSGHPLYSTPSLRLGVNPGQTVTVDLGNPKYNIRVPAGVLSAGHGSIAIAQRYDPNDISKILGEVAFWSAAGIASGGASGLLAWLISIGVVLLFF